MCSEQQPSPTLSWRAGRRGRPTALVVVEVGLGHPAFRAAAAHHETTRVVGVGRDGEAAVRRPAPAGSRPPLRHHRRQRVLVGGHHPHNAKVSSRKPSCVGGHLRTPTSRAARCRAHEVGELAPPGTSILLSTTARGRSAGRRAWCRSARRAGGPPTQPPARQCHRVATGFDRAQSITCTRTAQRLDVAQEVQAQPATGGCAGDQAGHVGDSERRVHGRHHAEVGDQRGERVVRDLRLGRRDRRHERGFARRGEADQPHVGDGFQPRVRARLPCSPSSAKPGPRRWARDASAALPRPPRRPPRR